MFPNGLLAIGSPPTLVAFSLLGMFIVGFLALRKRVLEPRVAVTFLTFFLPFSAFLLLHPSIYDTMRLFLFLIEKL